MKLLPPSLQTFHAVARLGTVHAAARALHLTQTGVTRRIASLETELGQSLFLRSRRGMTLTEGGRALLAYCQQALDLEGEVMSQLASEASDGPTRLVIQGPSSVMRSRVIPQVCRVLTRHPQVAVEFRLNDISSGVDALKLGDTDLAILPRRAVVKEFDSRRLRPERYVLVGPKKWAARSVEEVIAAERIIDFDPEDRMTFTLLEAHGLLAKARTDRHFVNNTDALAAMVEEGLGYSVLAAEFADVMLESGRLARLGGRRHLDYDIALAWYPRRYMARYFADALKAIK